VGRIYYRFHPRFGENVLIKRRLEHCGVELVVILQSDSSLASIPAWMTNEDAPQYTLSDEPHFSVDILRSLRAVIDALLGFLQSESKMDEADDDASIRKTPTKSIRRGRTARGAGGRSTHPAGGSDGSSAARDRDRTGKPGDRR
jgi:hypothetical protein